ncbi:hypothetical protein [Mycobacterium sp. 1274761.0]|uniref:hypothetical protein n=1 Tax=Mycobacterium sp. 1274761.0 TaxID=1834077 RepID=UPI0007FC3F7F|nr:hypothetical protein [Mycobacterium sp. 1274761.0]OBK74911.1 hypothetical protein A5651_08445 [Mycobacterium sp. 1274761.0]
MHSKTRYLAMLLVAAGASAVIAVAPMSAAAPQCTNTGPNTTQCETNGSTQIVTSPPANNNYPYWGFPIIGVGGIGIGW